MTLANQTIKRGINTLSIERSGVIGHYTIMVGRSASMNADGDFLAADWYTTPPIESSRAGEIFRNAKAYLDRWEWNQPKVSDYMRTVFLNPDLASVAHRGFTTRKREYKT